MKMIKRMRADERLCPICAEKIKRAAVKCRFCGSPVVPEPPERTETTRPSSVPPPLSDEPTPEATGKRSRWLPLLFLLLLAAIAGLVLAITRANAEEVAPDGTVTSNSARAVAIQAAAESTAQVLSYQSDSFDEDAAEAGKLMTESMREDYLKALEPVKADVVKDGISLKATVVATSLVSYQGDTVKALVFVNQSTTAKGSSNEQLDKNRVEVTMQRDGDGWLISKMEPF